MIDDNAQFLKLFKALSDQVWIKYLEIRLQSASKHTDLKFLTRHMVELIILHFVQEIKYESRQTLSFFSHF